MANTTETVLLQVDIQANTARLAEIQKGLNDNAASLKALNAAFKDNQLSAEELAAGQVRLRQEAGNLKQEQAALSKANTDQTRALQAEAGSIEQLRAQLSLGTAAFIQLGKAKRQDSEEGQRLQASNKTLSDNLKILEKSIGSTGRNVGNYNDNLQAVNATNGKAAGFFDKLKDSAAGLPGPLKATAGGLAETGSGLLTATKAALAFIATPLGLFLAAITAAFYILKEAFTATDEGQEDLAAGTAALGAVFGVLERAVLGAAKFLIKVFTDPKEAATDLLEFIESQVVNRVKALGVIFEALKSGDFKQATNGVLQYATGVEDVIGKTQRLTGETRRAAEAAAGISRAKDRLEDLEIAAIARAEKQKQQAEKLLLTARDRNLTEQQRLANLDEASRLEQNNLQTTLGIEKERLRIIQQENAESARRGVLQDEQRRAEAEQLATLAQKQGEYDKQEQVRDNRRATLLADEAQKRAEAAKKAAEARQQAIEDEIKQRQAATQAALLTVSAGSERELELQRQLVAQKAELEQAGAKKTAADRKLIVAQSYVELLKLEEDFLHKQQDTAIAFQQKGDAERLTAYNAEKKRQEEAVKDIEANFKRDEAMLTRYLERRRAQVENDYAEGRSSKASYDKAIQLLDETSFGARIALGKHYSKDVSKLEEEQAKKHNDNLKGQREAERRLNQQRLSEAEQFGAQVGGLFAEVLTNTGESLQEFAGKVLILILDTLEKTMLASAAEAAGKSLATNPTPAGIVQAAVTSGLIVAAFETAKAVVGKATQHPFNVGGIIPNDGSPNRDSVHAYLTPGEAVMTRTAVQQYGPLLGHLNAMAGGVNFAPGYQGPALAPRPIDGGLMARQLGNGVHFDYDKLAAASAKHPIAVDYTAIQQKAGARQAKIDRFSLK